MTTKRKKVEEYIIQHGSITSLEAITNFWATRLADIIYKLKLVGWVFEETERVPHPSGSSYGKYKLISVPDDYYD